MRKRASSTEKQALENFQKRVEEVAGVLERNSLLAIENCGTHQGADFCIGLESAARIVSKCDSERMGVNLDLEAALVEGYGRLPVENFWESLDSFGTSVHSIQLGVSALGPHRSWIEGVLEIASIRGTVRTVAIEDSKFLDHSDLQAAVRVATDALGLSF
jgi:sugar phosphate isomerase/epimerase